MPTDTVDHGRPHVGANGVSWPRWKNGLKIKKWKHAKNRAIRAGRCRERRYADHIFIQTYFRMHHFVVKFSLFSSPQVARGHWPPVENPADVLVVCHNSCVAAAERHRSMTPDWMHNLPRRLAPYVDFLFSSFFVLTSCYVLSGEYVIFVFSVFIGKLRSRYLKTGVEKCGFSSLRIWRQYR